MNDFLAQLAKSLSLPATAILAAVGGVVGGTIYNSFSGALLGVVMVIGVIGILAVLASLVAALTGSPVEAVYSAAITAVDQIAFPALAAGSHAMNGHAAKGDAAVAAPAAAIEATESEAQLLAQGKFAAYHLAKAKRLFAAGDMKEAAYQAGASMSHVDNREAAALRKAALAAAK